MESKFPRKRRLLASDDDNEDDGYEDSDDEDVSWMTRSTRYSKNVLYKLFDSEKFQPPKKRPK